VDKIPGTHSHQTQASVNPIPGQRPASSDTARGPFPVCPNRPARPIMTDAQAVSTDTTVPGTAPIKAPKMSVPGRRAGSLFRLPLWAQKIGPTT
jgi:hypothetical protein